MGPQETKIIDLNVDPSEATQRPFPENIEEGVQDTVLPLPTKEQFLDMVKRHTRFSLGKEWGPLSAQNLLHAVSLAVRDLMVDRMLETERRYQKSDAKRVYYLSMEFLVGRSLGNNLMNMGVYDTCRDALGGLGVDLEDLREVESDAALGNGGLGRLAACFLDSMATMGMPGFGYGINYEYGLFRQEIENGFQKEKPDHWRAAYSPWLIERTDEEVRISIYGTLAHGTDRHGQPRPQWVEARQLVGLPFDMPIVGYGGRTVNYLRLYSARASDEFDIQKFNEGDYVRAVEDKIASETISKVLYPSDQVAAGRELRLIQEYFFVACAVRDIVRRYQRRHANFDLFPQRVAIQLNDTHPALAVAELMRVLMDENLLSFDKAWQITTATLGYTNHTLLPEALEKWPEPLLHKVLPRHLLIIHEINRRFLARVAELYPGDNGKQERMSILEDAGGHKMIRMANLAIVGSHAVNGVAALHSDLVKRNLVPDFHELWPEKFSNKTNGVTQRRWLLKANPGLAALLTEAVGDGWITDLDVVRGIEKLADDASFHERLAAVKLENKRRLARVILDTTKEKVDPESMFTVIAKRIHEYKRQLLMAMRALHEYLSLVEDRRDPVVPRTYIFAGKAAPGYWAAKQVIKLVNALARVVNNDPRVRDRMKVVFIPDYRVSLAEKIIPAADLSEQISTAGKEASGTGNMKFSMNGALTMCTRDGANLEIMEEVGEENIYTFGLTADRIAELRATGAYNPWEYYNHNPAIRRMMDAFNSDRVFARDSANYHWIFHSILNAGDPYFHLADFEDYLEAETRAGREFRKPDVWYRKVVTNVARVGKFSSDRTVREYGSEIWKVGEF